MVVAQCSQTPHNRRNNTVPNMILLGGYWGCVLPYMILLGGYWGCVLPYSLLTTAVYLPLECSEH